MPKARSTKKKSTKAAFQKFAKTSKKRSGGIQCGTCRHADLAAEVRAVLQTWVEDDEAGDPDLAGLYDLCREAFPDYELKQGAFRKHIRVCEADLWSKLDG